MKVAKSRDASPITSVSSKPKMRIASFSEFEADRSKNEIERAAQFLDWAAKHMPYRFVPYTWVAKHAIIRPRLPGPDSPEVVMIRKKIGSIKVVLWKSYNRRTVPSPRNGEIVGLRATVDDDDIAGTDFLNNKRRIHSGIKRLADTRSKIDPKRMRDPGLKSLVRHMDPVLEQLTAPELMSQLKELPPRRDDDD